MKKLILGVLVLINASVFAQKSYKSGEFLKYRAHYGAFTGGYATLSVADENYNGKAHYHVFGKGWNSSLFRTFFKIEDYYETIIQKGTLKPSKFIRKINEGGYTKNMTYEFNHSNKSVVFNDFKNKKVQNIKFKGDIQDMISAFFHLREFDMSKLKIGEFINVNVYMDEAEYPIRVKLLGRESIKTKFGKVSCLKMRPYVLAGDIFKAEESVTMWITDDVNKVPVLIKSELRFGSLKFSLDEYKNTVTPIGFSK